MQRVTFLSVLIVVLCPAFAKCTQFTSCDDIRGYWQRGAPSDVYTRIDDMKRAVEFLMNQPADCPLYDVERVRWAHPDSLLKFATTFSDTESRTLWAKRAATEYQNYLDWFLSLDSSEKDALIQAVKHKAISDPDFRNVRRVWIRTRVGSVLTGLETSYEMTKDYRSLLRIYAGLVSECDGAPQCIEIFPAEILDPWSMWLKSMPDFKYQRKDDQIRTMVRDDDECRRAWVAFKVFLDQYLPANPSVREQWESLRRRIRTWLNT